MRETVFKNGGETHGQEKCVGEIFKKMFNNSLVYMSNNNYDQCGSNYVPY